MKKSSELKWCFAFLPGLAVAGICGLLVGCANLGNGQLDGPVVDAAKNVDKAALVNAGAAAAAGDYVGALSKIAAAAQKKKQATIEFDQALKEAGYAFTAAMYFDGALIEDEKRFSKRERYERVTVGSGSLPSAPASSAADDEEWLDDLIGVAEEAGIGKVLVGY